MSNAHAATSARDGPRSSGFALIVRARVSQTLATDARLDLRSCTAVSRSCVTLRVTTHRYSRVLRGTHGYSIRTPQRADLQVHLALTRRRSGVRAPQRPRCHSGDCATPPCGAACRRNTRCDTWRAVPTARRRGRRRITPLIHEGKRGGETRRGFDRRGSMARTYGGGSATTTGTGADRARPAPAAARVHPRRPADELSAVVAGCDRIERTHRRVDAPCRR